MFESHTRHTYRQLGRGDGDMARYQDWRSYETLYFSGCMHQWRLQCVKKQFHMLVNILPLLMVVGVGTTNVMGTLRYFCHIPLRMTFFFPKAFLH